MTSIPFSKHLAMGEPPSFLSEEDFVQMPTDVQQLLNADKSQLEAVRRALTNNITLVQGPPGTGILWNTKFSKLLI